MTDTAAMRLSAGEAAARLGVKRETLYAYVSRGLLTSERSADGRSSTFAHREVEALAERSRRGGRAGSLEVVVASGLTLIEDDHLWYRGRDVAELAVSTSFEAVAEWLWSGDVGVLAAPPRWPSRDRSALLAGAADRSGMGAPAWVQDGVLAAGADAIDRLRVMVAAERTSDDLRYDLAPAAVMAAGRRILTAMVDGLPLRSAPSSGARGGRLADRLWPRLATRRPTAGLVGALNAVLVLLADHELAASTLAARVAASVRADPYSVVSTGLGVIAGGLHGAASQPVVSLLDEIGTPGRAAAVVGERLRGGGIVPGLGHQVYRRVDPRAEVLLELLRELSLPAGRWSVVEALLALVHQRLDLVVNVDLALGALVYSAGLDRSAAEATFAIARTAGWLAHAMEEYGEPAVRFRPRAAYTGPRPDLISAG